MKELEFSKSLVQFATQTDPHNLFSTGHMELLRKLNRLDLSARDLSKVIVNNPAITARVLRVANSPYYGIPNKISTLNHAVSLLGVEQVRTLVQAFCFSEATSTAKGKARIFEPRSFAAHSLAVAQLAGKLAKHFGFQMLGAGEAETAGLLHDIGKSVLAVDQQSIARDMRNEYLRRASTTREDDCEVGTLLEAELEILGFTHAELGAWLASTWNLPLGVREAIYYSHGPIEECVQKEWACVVAVADEIANTFGMECLPTSAGTGPDPTILEFLERQGKLRLYENLPGALEKDIERVQGLHSLVSEDRAPQMEDSRLETVIEEHAPQPRAQVSVAASPGWSLLVPGLPQMNRGATVFGGGLFALFLGAGLLAVAFTLVGNGELAAGCAVAALLSWLVSVFAA
ncbi:MAG: HDOD domain-containing protein [Candidatus Omnitrophica bacterium]|nr:Ribonuclease Y [bacterium]NUN97596.1 HDOD domain-containing protein [Candidatus Omnitrophota bacterium]